MVDTIRRPEQVGSVKPLSPLRPVARRRHSRQNGDDAKDDDARQAPENGPAAAAAPDTENAHSCRVPPREEDIDDAKPGRCIDVHV